MAVVPDEGPNLCTCRSGGHRGAGLPEHIFRIPNHRYSAREPAFHCYQPLGTLYVEKTTEGFGSSACLGFDQDGLKEVDSKLCNIHGGSHCQLCPPPRPASGRRLSTSGCNATYKWIELDAGDVAHLEPPSAKELVNLMRLKYVRVFTLFLPTNALYFPLRIYVLPQDVAGSNRSFPTKNYKSELHALLRTVDKSPSRWEGMDLDRPFDDGYKSIRDGYTSAFATDESLFYVFNTLPSPDPDPEQVSGAYAAAAMRNLLEDGKAVPGLQTDLYPYQRRSSATMIQRETQPMRVLDPRLQRFVGPTGTELYIDIEQGRVCHEQKLYDEARGGILAETMGYGKTLICLAVILTTKGQIPAIPPEDSLWIGHVPEQFERDEEDQNMPSPPTLAEECALAIARHNISWREYFHKRALNNQHFERCVNLLERKIGSYSFEITEGRGRHQQQIKRTVRLASTTLIIVPANLLQQWQREIHHHVQPEALSVFVVKTPHTTVPEAKILALYDVVLMTRSRFERELLPCGSNSQNTKEGVLCDCADKQKRHLCRIHPYRSPLLDLHFLRLIVDEGEGFSSGSTTNALQCLYKMRVERRWIVSGTPAGAFVGAEVDLAAEQSETLPRPVNQASANIQSILEERKRIWDYREERKLLQRLGTIVISFLGVQPWSNKHDDVANWTEYLVPKADGTRKPLSLRRVLNGIVVRHQYEDIEADLPLPPLENRLVHLQPSFHDKLSMNLFILSLLSNAVTSERRDQDYMFHPRNRKVLEVLIRNLRHCGFAWSGSSHKEIEATCRVSRSYLENDANYVSEDDRSRLEQACKIGDLALQTPAWNAFHEKKEIGFWATGFDGNQRRKWALCPELLSDLHKANPSPPAPFLDPLLLSATQLTRLQDAVEDELYHPAFDYSEVITRERTVHDLSPPLVAKSDLTTIGYSAGLQNSFDGGQFSGKGIPRSSLQETKSFSAVQFFKASVRTRSKSMVEREKKDDTADWDLYGDSQPRSILRTTERKPDVPPTYPQVSKSMLVGTSSAKLSYLIDKVSSLYKQEKILVFYEGDDIAYYCAQAFELLDIPHLIYASGISQDLRNEYQTMFNAGSLHRVMLMDLKQAAFGLHMASASRVFFINPVWQPTIEAQAIKRAHRIGQKRPVFVETLVLDGTLEQQMLERRKAMTAEEHQKAARSLLDDNRMKDIIQQAQLLPISAEEINDPEQQFAKLQQPQHLFGRSILEAYGSQEAVMDAWREQPPWVDPVISFGNNAGRAKNDTSKGTSLNPSAKPGKRKRKLKNLDFVDELERRHVGKETAAEPTPPPTDDDDDDMGAPPGKRARTTTIRFADEEDLPLSTIRVFEADSSVPEA